MAQKLTFNTHGWIVICIERGSWLQHLRFDTKKAAQEFLKENSAAWFCG